MPTILGLHFGHDGAAAIIRDGELLSYIQRERLTRVKHDYSLNRACLSTVFAQAGLGVNDIDFCAVTSTQKCDIPLVDIPELELRYTTSSDCALPCPLLDELSKQNKDVVELCAPSMIDRVLNRSHEMSEVPPVFAETFEKYRNIDAAKLRLVPWFEGHVTDAQWSKDYSFNSWEEIDAKSIVESHTLLNGFHLPLEVELEGRKIPGIRVDHHLAHSASSFFRSGLERALIITNDGYGGECSLFSNGGIYFGEGARIYPVWPHQMIMGYLYDKVAYEVGFLSSGGAGKLMGLAPYGRAKYFDPRWVGTMADLRNRGLTGHPDEWIRSNSERATLLYGESMHLRDRIVPFSQFQLDLSASTQMLIERQWEELVRFGFKLISQFSTDTNSLCLSGGAALNCPSNTHLFRTIGAAETFIEPSCNDSGLCIGAALWLHHALSPEGKNMKKMQQKDAFCGPVHQTFKTDCKFKVSSEPARPQEIALELSKEKIVALYEGSSEQGPRALGHRSILASPFSGSMQTKINNLKRRELWRPFAPAVLEEYIDEYFTGGPITSPYMLFTYFVLRPSDLRAITHIDGSARVQSVTNDCGVLYQVLQEFQRITGCPVLLNTSFNGPAEPIVESPREALKFLEATEIDILFLDGNRCERHSSSSHTLTI